jgi:hypothetical protein
MTDEARPSKRGAMYRPATEDTFQYIEELSQELQISWNAAVNMLVRLGIRVHSESPAVRNGGHF